MGKAACITRQHPMLFFKVNLPVVMDQPRAPLLEASALAGQTPLRLASSFDFTWDFSLYSEGFFSIE
jgi:hypothetical protein